MDAEALRRTRGFGPAEPWPATIYAGGQRAAALAAAQLAPELVARRLATGALVACPERRGWEAPSRCTACPQLRGLLGLPGDDRAGEALGCYRVRCGMPVARALAPLGRPVAAAHAARIEAGARVLRPGPAAAHGALGRLWAKLRGSPPSLLTAAERRVFLSEAHLGTCPLSRAEGGAWTIEAPPCPACPHYLGLVAGGRATGARRGAVAVLCGHEQHVPLRRVADGAALEVPCRSR